MLLDANLLLYASLDDFPQHPAAREWLAAQLNGPRRIGVPWLSLLAFLRITTNTRLFDRPLDIETAWHQIQTWLSHPRVWVPAPGQRHSEILARMLIVSHASGNLVPDAHMAALALEHGLALYSTDHDFASFPDLHWINPLSR
jgi:hypothetical protein